MDQEQEKTIMNSAMLNVYLKKLVAFDEIYQEWLEKKIPKEGLGIGIMDWKQRRQELIDLIRAIDG